MLLPRLSQDLTDVPRWVANVEDSVSRAAVAAIVAPVRGVSQMLFIRRATVDGDPWSGHIAFPGGRLDEADASDEAAVCREVLEEVGLDLKHMGTGLGRLSDVVSPPLKLRVVVTPFVYVLDTAPTLELEVAEVAAALWLPLDKLIAGEGRGTFRYKFRGQSVDLGCVELGGARIWGMTLRILDELLERVKRVNQHPAKP
jgi:8-oxo-dGTP pyrophosphatase MutT (NUDIX family)